LELYFDGKIIVFYNGHINREFEFLVEDMLLDDFKVTEDIINHLKEISTFEESVEYLRNQLIFYSL